jgi:hypothetical protein
MQFLQAGGSIIYQSADTVGIEFTDDGMMLVSNRQVAVAMVERHYSGRYRIVAEERRCDPCHALGKHAFSALSHTVQPLV